MLVNYEAQIGVEHIDPVRQAEPPASGAATSLRWTVAD
jgi:hypothetical protein